jgi:hypothetical protein
MREPRAVRRRYAVDKRGWQTVSKSVTSHSTSLILSTVLWRPLSAGGQPSSHPSARKHDACDDDEG